jgi:hypothetical protein
MYLTPQDFTRVVKQFVLAKNITKCIIYLSANNAKLYTFLKWNAALAATISF